MSIVYPDSSINAAQVEAHVEREPFLYLIDKAADVLIDNQSAGLILAGALGTSVVLYVVSLAVVGIIKALRT